MLQITCVYVFLSNVAVCFRSFFAKEPLITGLFCGKSPIQVRHPITLHHPVVYIYMFSIYICFCIVYIYMFTYIQCIAGYLFDLALYSFNITN